MKKIAITPALLERYHNGRCSDEEKQAIREWLTSAEDEESALSPEGLQKMETEIWAAVSGEIHDGKQVKVVPLFYRKVLRYAVAACLVIGVGLGLKKAYNNLSFEEGVLVSNTTSHQTKLLKTSDMALTLMPKSKASFYTNIARNRAQLTFSGKIAFTNKLNEDVRYTIRNSQGAVREVTLKKNTAYYIFQSKDAAGKDRINVYDRVGIQLYYEHSRVPKALLSVVMKSPVG